MHYDISREGRTIRVVDFDDASSKLIRHWATKLPFQQADVLVSSHHGSRNNDVSLVLDNASRHGLKAVLITVNRHNRYNHPAPEVLSAFVEKLGPDHVFVTDSEIGNNVIVNVDGIKYQNNDIPRKRLERFVRAQVERYEATYRTLFQKASESVVSNNTPISLNVQSLEDVGSHLATKGFLKSSEASSLKKTARALTDLGKTLDMIGKTRDQRQRVVSGYMRTAVPLTLGKQPETVRLDTPENGIDRWKIKREISANYPSLYVAGLRRLAGSSGVTNLPNSRVMHFRRLVRQQTIPVWGGVVLGNEVHYDGPLPRSMEFIEAPPLFDGLTASGALVLRIVFNDGSIAEYANVTPVELRAAYNFVQPTGSLKQAYGKDLTKGSGGLVGIYDDFNDAGVGWKFAVHPAIAGTVLARDAMRLDMLIVGATQSKESLPLPLKSIPWKLTRKPDRCNSYQWYDAEAEIVVKDGWLNAQPIGEPSACILRVRLVSWYDPDRCFSEILIAREYFPLIRALENLTNDRWQVREDHSFSDAHVSAICEGFDAAATMDRFARLVAVLNWYVENTGKALPKLPASLESAEATGPSAWSLGSLFGNVEVAELEN